MRNLLTILRCQGMAIWSRWSVFTVAGVGLLLASCAAPEVVVSDPNIDANNLYRLRPGDVIEISVFREPDMTSRQRVLGDGTIAVGYLGRVSVEGDTIDGASRKLQSMLTGKFLVSPQVSISVESYASRKFTVLGQVRGAGNFEIPAEGVMSLPEAIAMAGGNSEIGDLRKVMVNRRNGDKVERVRVDALSAKAQFFYVREGDVIVVPETLF